jgi:hypothetical protein
LVPDFLPFLVRLAVVRLGFAIGAHYAIHAVAPANEKTPDLALFGAGLWQRHDELR